MRAARSAGVGREQQRLLIAEALVSQPRMLFLDEPLDSLDLPNQAAVAGLLESDLPLGGDDRVARRS